MNDLRGYLAELFGTFALVFAGTGAIVVNQISHGALTHVGVSLVFGLIVFALIMTLGDVSGCHINPAVSIGLWLAHRFAGRHLLPYLLAQFSGAILASMLLRCIFPDVEMLGNTLPYNQLAGTAFVMETILTFLLMVVILGTTVGNESKTAFAGLAIGSVIALEALVGGPICGASMNPARSFGPALMTLHFEFIWVYLTAPVLGAVSGVAFARLLRPSELITNESPS